MTTRRFTFIPCSLEKTFLDAGYELYHDGLNLSGKEQGNVQFVLPPEDIHYFTRKLKLMRNGRLYGKAWFKYDLRKLQAHKVNHHKLKDLPLVDFGFKTMDADGVKQDEQRMILTSGREAQ